MRLNTSFPAVESMRSTTKYPCRSNWNLSSGCAFASDGSFLVAWHEEQFPALKTVVQPVRLPAAR